jgi:hypothetical protein
MPYGDSQNSFMTGFGMTTPILSNDAVHLQFPDSTLNKRICQFPIFHVPYHDFIKKESITYTPIKAPMLTLSPNECCFAQNKRKPAAQSEEFILFDRLGAKGHLTKLPHSLVSKEKNNWKTS